MNDPQMDAYPLTAKDIDSITGGDVIWIKGTVTSVDPDGEVWFDFLHLDPDNEDEEGKERDEEYSSTSIYKSALKTMYGNAGRPIMVGDVVTSKTSPGIRGTVVAIYRGQATIDWSYGEDTLNPSLSILSIGALVHAS